MKEQWLPVVGYEGFYLISSIGNIIALPRERRLCNLGGPYTAIYKGFTMKPNIDRYGYKKIGLRGADGVRKYFTIHRLVAIAFIPNPKDKPQINHLDSDKLNNTLDNLEWCTNAENHQHAYENGTHALCLHRCPVTGRMQPMENAG